MSKVLTLFVFLLCPSVMLAAVNTNVRFQHIDRSDGLSQSYVYSITQDETGYMWFGTQDGLNRYDGYDLTVYSQDPGNPGSLVDDGIRDLVVDSKGRLWIGTGHGGLSRYDAASEGFVNYLPGGTNHVRAIVEAPNGDLWVGTDGEGLKLFEPETGEFSSVRVSGLGREIWALALDSENRLWLGAADGLYRYDLLTNQVRVFRHDSSDASSISSNHVRELLIDDMGQLWVGTDQGGVNRFDEASETFVRFTYAAEDTASLSNNTVTSMFQDAAGQLWFGTMDGLNRLQQDRNFERFYQDQGNRFSVAHSTIMSIYQDQSNALWVGTYKGISRWNQLTESLRHLTADRYRENALSNPTVSSMESDDNGDVWIGTFGGGLNLYNFVTGQFEHYRFDADIEGSLPDDRVMELDTHGNLWVGTRAAGLALLDAESGKFERFVHDSNDKNSLGADGVTSILSLADGRLLVGTYGAGLSLYDGATFKRYSHNPSDADSISDNRVIALYQDSLGQVWVGTHGAGLNRFNLATGAFERLRHNAEDPGSISGDNVFNIIEDSKGNLWVGTQRGGLNLWRAEDRALGKVTFEHFTESSGLADTSVQSMQFDNTGKLWIASNQGLTRFNPTSGNFTHFDTSHGLQSAEFNHNAATSQGELLFFGGINGFNQFNPVALSTSAHKPNTVVTSLSHGTRALPALPRLLTNGIELAHHEHTLDIRYAGLDYTAPELNRYQYQLIGLHENWVDAGNRRYASFTNLAPGEYTFNVRSANSQGDWGQTSSFGIQVNPAPWLSLWAYLIYFSVAALIVSAIYLVQRKKLQHAAEVLEINEHLSREVKARKLNEVALEFEKTLTQTYLDVAEVALLVMDRFGTVEVVNRKACEVLAAEEIDLEKRNIREFLPDVEQSVMLDKIADLTREESGFYIENTIRTIEGFERQIMWRLSVLPGPGNQVIASGMDVTEARKLEKVVQLREKLAAVGTMASGIVHDFNNILTAISGYGELSLNRDAGPVKTRAYLEKIMEASERASELVGRLLTFTQGEEKDFEPVNPTKPIREACELLRVSLSSSIEMRIDVPDNLGMVLGDASQLHQVIMNLGTNADKAMQGRVGELDVSASVVPLRESDIARGSVLKPGDHLCIKVSDTGVGMSPEVGLRIFESFYSSKALGYGESSGTGLGLSVVHGIVDAHGGTIEVDSMQDIGTTFTILMPLCGQVARDPEHLQKKKPGDPLHVLLVDDEPWLIEITEEALEMEGHTVETFNHPVDALVEFKADPGRFDLVITDQNMPAMKGEKLIAELKRLAPELKVILVSGNVKPANLDDVAFLKKPFMFNELTDAVCVATKSQSEVA